MGEQTVKGVVNYDILCFTVCNVYTVFYGFLSRYS